MSDPVQVRRELAEASEELIGNPAFKAAIEALRKQWLSELTTEAIEPDRVLRLASMLAALEAIPQRLQVFINDQMVYKRKSG